MKFGMEIRHKHILHEMLFVVNGYECGNSHFQVILLSAEPVLKICAQLGLYVA
jgi:hypothetical protein